MATQASCNHPPLHDNIIFKQYIIESQNEVHNRNILFIIIEKTLLIVDCANYVKECTQCGKCYRIYIYGIWPDVRASFDGVTDLPIRAMVNDIKGFPYITICNAPRFGNNFIYGCNMPYHVVVYFVIYGIEVTVKGCSLIVHKRIFIDDDPAICCYTVNGKFILIDCCGNTIKAEVAYSETRQLFKIGNGYLSGEYIDNYRIDWTYTSSPALNTKPAVAAQFTNE